MYFENFVIDFTTISSLFFQEETTPCKVSVTLTQTSEAAPVNMKASGAYYAGGEDLTLLTSQVSNCFDINLMTVST